MKLTLILVVLTNQIRQVRRVHLSHHLFHRVRPFQAFQVDRATLSHHRRIHSPFLDRTARHFFQSINKPEIISCVKTTNFNGNKIKALVKYSFRLLLRAVSFLPMKRMRVQIISRLHIKAASANKILIIYVVEKKCRANVNRRCIGDGPLPHTREVNVLPPLCSLIT